jgi:hypothetical protein
MAAGAQVGEGGLAVGFFREGLDLEGGAVVERPADLDIAVARFGACGSDSEGDQIPPFRRRDGLLK